MEISIKEFEKYDNELIEGIKLANKYLWGLSNFKRFISQYLKTENDEDQWTRDYESYCLCLFGAKKYIHPGGWAEDYYQERWDIEKMNKSLETIRKIASGEIKYKP